MRRGRVVAKALGVILSVLLALVLAIFWILFFSPVPPLATEPAGLAGDGSALDSCPRPTLDGHGKKAVDIPKGNTPGCRYDHFPLPIPGECTEPLAEGASAGGGGPASTRSRRFRSVWKGRSLLAWRTSQPGRLPPGSESTV